MINLSPNLVNTNFGDKFVTKFSDKFFASTNVVTNTYDIASTYYVESTYNITRISSKTEPKRGKGGWVWEQTSLGGVKIRGVGCCGQAASRMCRLLRFATDR